MKSESKIQQEIYIWYNNKFCLKHHSPRHIIFSVPNESNSKAQTIKKMAIGLVAGVSDLIVIQPNKILFIEVKTPTGLQRPNQADFEETVKNLGFEYHIARSLEDFRKIVE